jgi:CHASE2 domain-containing sensor protein/predicted Ser/Thr protein kinase
MRKNLSSYLLYALITILVVSLYLGDFSGLRKLEWKIDDLMYTFRSKDTSSPDIILVNIDDTSRDKLGNWPWSYDVLADLIAVCNTGRPKAMLVDLDLTSRVSEDTTDNTRILANQISWAENVVLPYDIALAEYSHQRMSKPEYLWKSSIQTDYESNIFEEDGALNIRKPFLPSGLICQYVDGMGFTYIEYDDDRKVRWAPLAANYDGYYYPSAPLLTAATFLGFKPEEITLRGSEIVEFGPYTIPTDRSGRVFINYNTPRSTFAEYSAADLFDEKFNLRGLKGNLVIIGLTAGGAGEFYSTPVSPRMSRAELSANVIENIIHQNHIQRLDLSAGISLLILIGFGAFCAIFLPRIPALYRIIVLTVCLFIMANVCYILFNSHNMLSRPLYLGLELVLFIIAAPLIDQARFRQGFGFGTPVPSVKKTKDREPLSLEEAPVRELKDTGNEAEFQETEMVGAFPDSAQPPPPAAHGHKPAADSTTPAATAQAAPAAQPPPAAMVQKTPSPSSSPTDSSGFADQSPAPTPIPGSPEIDRLKNLGRYQVAGVLGKGAMGTVFKGVDPAIGRPVALKTIRLDFVSDETEMAELRDRLLREAQAAGKLSHPNIVTIYDAGSEGTLQYIAMEYLEGQTLEQLTKKRVQFSYKIIANIITQTCKALEYAHDQGIVHRDIKPANIMVLSDYSIKVMDFGIARIDTSSMTRTGIAMGTPNYIAPELLQGKNVDRRCDIFSLGVVIYELLTGRRPFKGENLTALVYSIVNDDPPPPSSINENLPLIFDHITSRALSKNPVDRYQKASDLRLALADFVGSFEGSKKAVL